MKLAISSILMVVWALVAASCSASPDADPRKLAPANATFLGELRVADILKDLDLEKLYAAAPKEPGDPQTIQDLLASQSLAMGIDLRAIRTAVVFGDSSAEGGYMGAILQGEFNPENLAAVLSKPGLPGLTETKYKDRLVYVRNEGDGSNAYSLLSGELLAVGDLAAVKSVIDVHRGEQPPISGVVWDTFQALGNPMFRLAAQVPKGAFNGSDSSLGDLPGLGGMPLGTEALESLEVVGLSLDRTGQKLKLRAQLDFGDAGSASRLEAMLSGGLSLLRGFSGDRQLRDLLDQVQVKVAGKRLEVLLQATVADLQALASKPGLLP